MKPRATAPRIAPAAPAEAAAIRALLAAEGLPHDDIEPHLPNFLVMRADAEVIAAVGLEVNGPDALLRSLVVAPSRRNSGLGRALVREISLLARERGVERLFLLTTAAVSLFERAGFARVDRGTAPPAIAASAQFRGLCPASAVCLSASVRDVPARKFHTSS